jgi:prepilin signal peptidase PulO-like enzyme (type II secretory pathway)
MMRDWLLVSALIVIFVYDLRWQLVPMGVVWSMCVLMLVFNILLGYSWVLIIISALVATAFFWIQYILTKKKGLGEGDIWLGLLLGLSFPNFSHLLAILIISYGAGSLVSLILLLVKKKHRKSRIALGPFLAFGAIITLIWGDQLINWYLGLFS